MNQSLENKYDNKMELQKRNDQEAGAKELNEIFENVLPWALEAKNSKQLLAENTLQKKDDINLFLDSLLLFKVTEISVTETKEDISSLIHKRQQSLITAAYQSNFTITIIIVGDGGGTVDVYFGVSEKDDDAETVFKNQAKGIFPGKGITFIEEKTDYRIIKEQLKKTKHGGIITGIPTQKIDDEKQAFDLTSVIRSMNGEEFVLVIASRPVSKEVAAQQIQELMALKDRCHALSNRTVGSELTTSQNESKTSTRGKSSSDTKGTTNTAGINIGAGVPMGTSKSFGNPLGGLASIPILTSQFAVKTVLAPMALVGFNFSHSKSTSHTDTTSESKAETSGWSKTTGENLSHEQQNSLAMELELAADKLIKRLRTGLNTGIWENFITYATKEETASRILSGTLAGELIKADPKALPIRNVSSRLSEQVPLFIPKADRGTNLLTANKLVSFMSSDEVSHLMSPPLSSVPGFDIRVKPALSLTDTTGNSLNNSIAFISEHGRAIDCSSFSISNDDISKHIFVSGLTGSGKTTTVKQILNQANTPFLVLESAKREYRRLIPEDNFKGIIVYTIGNSELNPIRHNPFMVLPNVSLITHIDNLKSIFNASFSLYGPMPYILEKCLYNIYKLKGWNITTGRHNQVKIENFKDAKKHSNIYPSIVDLETEVNRYVRDEMDYKGELRDNIRSAIVARLESLAVGSKGFLFNTNEFIDIEDLLNKQVVFELESLADDDDKAFFVGLILTLVSEHRQSLTRRSNLDKENKIEGLKHIMIIEEAHRLLKNVAIERTSEMMGNPKGKAVESFCNIIAEMRSFGQGVIVAEQIPTKIAPDVIKNTNTKIIHRLVSNDDQVTIGASLGLNDEESRYLNQLSAGFALAHKEGMAKPVEICVYNTLRNNPIGDIRIAKMGKDIHENLEEKLNLHESGLLTNEEMRNITRRLVNSIFLSKLELKEVLPYAIKEVRNAIPLHYVTDKTIAQALQCWFRTMLFSPTLDLGNKKEIKEDIVEVINRFWTEGTKFNRDRLILRLEKWGGTNPVEKIRLFVENSIIIEFGKTDITAETLDELFNKIVLTEDVKLKTDLRESLKKRML